ncbi:MAG: hypothetical protein A2Y12_15350 [Planctomycetes bacterium GWF2_42_9]|nr:MAG: hypothetical protein A2Y12_15350 [Planctomycetes bacterium GWF2_42_9]
MSTILKLNKCFLVYVCFLGLFVCGCSESTQNKKNKNLASHDDTAFAKGANQKPTINTLYAGAKIYIHQGRLDKAESLLQRIIDQYPKYIPAYTDLAEIKIRKRKTTEAVDVLSKSINENGLDPKTLNNLGMCWMLRRDYSQALEMFTQAAGLDCENTRYRANMAMALALMQRDEEALALYRQILPADQTNKNMNILRYARSSMSQSAN